ncbi:MAG: hypothetical protein AAFQ94_20940 [Bacteroidota bacterium]
MREYKVISFSQIKNAESDSTRVRFNVLAQKTDNEEVVELKNISLPDFVETGDLIRWCEHQFYDIIDHNGDFIFRRRKEQ